ncbi:hypothetical protein BH10PSE3_BH10PSE3_35480 [soil metagenome]
MVWLCIIGLAVFAFVLYQRVGTLEAQVRALMERPGVAAAPAREPEPQDSFPPPRGEGGGEADGWGSRTHQTPPDPFGATLPTREEALAAPPPRTAPITPPAPTFTWAQASTWLAENGLAWLGGGGLALGGLLLVVYAAQRGVFTPPFRIAAAAILGLAMVAASEWIRCHTKAPGGRHALAAASAAGAGAVTLYGAVWAAHVLYALMPLPLAATLIVAVSGGLLALALLQGEALALLALLGAFLAPAITRSGHWPPFTLEAYLVLLAATGTAITDLRRWGRAGLATLAGLTLWALTVLFTNHTTLAAILLATALACPIAAVFGQRARAPRDAATNDLFAHLPLIGLITVSVSSVILWLGNFSVLTEHVSAPLLGALLLLAGVVLTDRRLIPPRAFVAPVASTVVGLLSSLLLHHLFARSSSLPSLLAVGQVLGMTALVAVAGLATGLRQPPRARTPLLAISAVGAAVLANLAWPLLDRLPHALPSQGGMAAGLVALLLAAGALLIARRVEEPARDPGLGLWVAAAAELAFLALHALTPDHVEPVAMALAALVLAAGANRLAWRGMAATAVAGAVVTLSTLLRPAFVLDATSGKLPLPSLVIVTALAVVALGAAARIVGARRRDHRTEAEALSTAALLTLLTGLFLILHAVLTKNITLADSANALLEASLRTALMLSAGLLLATRGRPDDGAISRWRLIVVVTAGATYGLLSNGLWLHPWWGSGSLAGGLPLLNDLLLTFLAPALLLAATARARPAADRWTRGRSAAAALFALLWAVTATRQAFHGAVMHIDPIGRAEACAYAVIGLLTARAFRIDRLRASRAAWLHAAAPVVGWTALASALLVFGWLASPWWGPSEAPMTSAWHVALVLALYAAGAGAALSLRRDAKAFDRAALCLSVGVLFALVTLAVRFAFHGADMRQGLDRGGLETWTFSAAWTVFGLAVLFRASARKDVALRWLGLVALLATAGKVLLFDMSTLDGVVRAASFLAVGALFIAGAVVARRLNTTGTGAEPESPEP